MSALPSLNTPATFNTRIYYPDTLDIRRNLAIEELLFNGLRDGQCLLLLWRSHDSVVIGKNQNPWKECHLTSMRSAGVMMARRRSGGGTVYHDPENLNFTYLLERSHADAKRQTRVVIDACKPYARLDSFPKVVRNSMELDDRLYAKWADIMPLGT